MSIAFSVTAYGKQENASAPMPDNSTAAATAVSKGIFDVTELGPANLACQDLNQFVNAKWIAANPIPNDHTSWGAFNQLAEKSLHTQRAIVEDAAKNAASAQQGSIRQKIGYLYSSGMDEAAIEKASYTPIKPQLDAIAALKNGNDVAHYISTQYSNGNAQVFGFGAGADYKNAALQIAYATQGGLGLPTKDYYLAPKYKQIRDAYLGYIAKSLKLTGVLEADAKKQAAAVLTFETELAKASLSPVQERDLKNQYHFVTVKTADKITPHFQWERFFKDQGVTIDKGFSLSQPKFFAEFDKLLATASIDQWQAYLRFNAINAPAAALSKDFVDNQFEFYGKTLSGQPEQTPRWKKALSAVNESMGMALGELYVKQEFTPEAKQRAEELVTNVRNALKTRIENVDWMSDATKKKALEKWGKLLPKIGYPEKWRDWSGLTIVPDNYYANLQAAAKFNYQFELSKIGKPTDRMEWGMTPQTVNAYYNPSDNTINFPAAILQPPFFYANGDDAINYGGIGAVIGHESTHSFDDQGRQFDGDGNQTNWWTPEDSKKFAERTGRLVQQFNDYTPIKDKPDAHVNGELTLGENIADLGGLNIAYDALQSVLKQNPQEANKKIDGYTEDQRFFLSWARVWRENVREKQTLLYLNVDPHAPSSLRAIGAPSNMDAFASAFQCKPTDPMVRSGSKQVKIW